MEKETNTAPLKVTFYPDEIAELYRMVQWWCHDQSNTFHYIKDAIEQHYPVTAKWNKVNFDWK